jgi:hypothetical protein
MSEYTWNLAELYVGPDDPQIEADLQRAEAAVAAFSTKWKPKTGEFSRAAILRQALDE